MEITDEMVERAVTAASGALFSDKARMREALKAALNPPPFEVTRAMRDAGGEEYKRCQQLKWDAECGWCGMVGYSTNEFAERIYRAMRKLEPK